MRFLNPISATRFDMVAGLSRWEARSQFGDEVGWYESADGSVFAVLVSNIELNYHVALLGRDLVGRYRWVHQTPESATPGVALAAASLFVVAMHAAGTTVYEQGDEGKPVDFFTPVVVPSKLHERFKLLSADEHYVAARAVVDYLMPWLENQDGNFVQQFQSDGFDARIWELYLFMMLRELGHQVAFPSPAPDFLATGDDGQFLVEATTANPVQPGAEPARPTSKEETDLYVENFVVSRYSNVLLKKLHKRYWELPHAVGLPLTIAVQDFHHQLSMTYSGNALQVYLYGRNVDTAADGTLAVREVKEHVWGTKTFPSGFFFQPDAENISAVLFNASGTISKFNRIGVGAGFGSPNVDLIHFGRRRDPDDPSGGVDFVTQVTEGYEEAWTDGLNVFHNPRAKRPLDMSLIPGAAHHFWDGEQFTVLFPKGQLESSITYNVRRVEPPVP